MKSILDEMRTGNFNCRSSVNSEADIVKQCTVVIMDYETHFQGNHRLRAVTEKVGPGNWTVYEETSLVKLVKAVILGKKKIQYGGSDHFKNTFHLLWRRLEEEIKVVMTPGAPCKAPVEPIDWTKVPPINPRSRDHMIMISTANRAGNSWLEGYFDMHQLKSRNKQDVEPEVHILSIDTISSPVYAKVSVMGYSEPAKVEMPPHTLELRLRVMIGKAECDLVLNDKEVIVKKWIKEIKHMQNYGGNLLVNDTFKEILRRHGLLRPKADCTSVHFDDALLYMNGGFCNFDWHKPFQGENPCTEIALGDAHTCSLQPANLKETKMPNIATLLRLADKSLEKDLAEFGELPLDVQAALKDEIAAEKAEASKAAAKEIMDLFKSVRTRLEQEALDIQNLRHKIETKKNLMTELNRAKAYGLEANNYLPLAMKLGFQLPVSTKDELTRVPKDFVPKESVKVVERDMANDKVDTAQSAAEAKK